MATTPQYFTKRSESWQKCCRCPGITHLYVEAGDSVLTPHVQDKKAIPSPPAQHYCCAGAVMCANLLFLPFFRDVPWCLHPQALKDVVVPVDHEKHACFFPECVAFSHKDMQEAGTVVPAWAVVLHLSCKISFCGGLLVLLLLGSHSRNMSKFWERLCFAQLEGICDRISVPCLISKSQTAALVWAVREKERNSGGAVPAWGWIWN